MNYLYTEKLLKSQSQIITFTFYIYQQLLSKVTYIHTMMEVAAMQGADQHIRNSILPKDTSACRQGESNQQPLITKTLYP